MSLQEYTRKRDFTKTPEPKPGKPAKGELHGGRFFIQRHNASRLHYDFRLEIDGTLKSWAVPKGPSLDPTVKHFAAMVEDHPLSYGDFEGNIPKGEYGGGSVMLWDQGTFELIGEEDGMAQIARGDLKFQLHGEKLSGTWALVHMKTRGKGNDWLIIKKKDEAAQTPWDIETLASSVKTGRSQEEIAGDLPAHKTKAPAKKKVQRPESAGLAKNGGLEKLTGAVRAPIPGFFEPMGATLADQLPKGPDWIFEVKWDGVRGLTFIDNESLSIYTRNNNRCERQYPELHVIPHYIEAEQAVLDGEIVVLDSKGISHFELIQPRIHTQDANAIAKMGQKNPVHLYVFDLLYLDGFDLRRVPLIERKRLLQKIMKPFPLLRVSDHFENAGEDLLEAARQSGLEGLIAKSTKSVYESRRSRNWLKLKVTSEQEFVIAGYTPGEREHFGSLALGYYEGGKLHYAGNVGTGFNARSHAELWTLLEPLKTTKMPFAAPDKFLKGTLWVKPKLVAQIKFANWTGDKKLRAPVYLGLRDDKPAADVSREEVPPPGFLPLDHREVTTTINGHSLKFTNLDKLYYPEDGYTKRDLLNYYDAVAELLLPYLKDRPLSLKRYPNGIHAEFFFQKNTPAGYPSWLQTKTVDRIRYVLADDRASLLYLTNLGCIDQNPWMSRVGALEHPDFILIDLDPQECPFSKIVEAALLVKQKLDAIGLVGYPKTTGGDGMHIYIPIEPVYSYEQARTFAEVISRMLAAQRPDLFTTPRAVAAREKNRVYFDYLQIAESKTISAPYVARAYAGAPVSTPLAWEEVVPSLLPSHFSIGNAPERFARVGDLFEGVVKKPQRIEQAFGKLESLLKR
ncbi:MAG TPA: DNA ligase D [Bryobacteraceae bacterium]|jgi:bifunctional non-homologous end joining protein LigD|nr:DNA ligase D [Bryobacteraceae bacterium]